MSDTTNDTTALIDEADLPLTDASGQPINYQQVLNADLLDLLGAKNIPEAERQRIYETAAQTVENRVLARIVDQLSDEELKQWEEIAEEDKDALHKFLTDHKIDLAKLYALEAVMYKTELASLSHSLSGE